MRNLSCSSLISTSLERVLIYLYCPSLHLQELQLPKLLGFMPKKTTPYVTFIEYNKMSYLLIQDFEFGINIYLNKVQVT